MPLVKALELAVNQYAIFDVDSFVAVLRSPHFSSQLADLIDSRRALIEATAGTANAEVQADIVDAADADVEPVVEVAVAETMVAEAFQIGDERVAREVAARHAAEERAVSEAAARQASELRAPAAAVDASTSTVDLTSMVDASTCHYLTVGVGLAHSSSQTEHDTLARAVMDGVLTLAEARWMQGLKAQPEDQPEDQPEAQPEEAPPQEDPLPPVFADCSHYKSTPASKPRVRRSRKALEW